MKAQGKVWIFYDSHREKQSKPMNLISAQIMVLNLIDKQNGRFFLWTPGWDHWALLEEYLMTEQSYFAKRHPPLPTNETASPVQSEEATEIEDSLGETTGEMNQTDEVGDTGGLGETADASERGEESNEETVTSVPLDSSPTLGDTTEVTQSGVREGSFTDVLLEKDLLGANDFYAPDFQGDDLSLSQIQKIKPAKEIEEDLSERRNNPRHDLKIEILLLTDSGKSFRSFSRNISISGTLLGAKIPKDFHNSKLNVVVINKFEKSVQKNRVALRGTVLGDLTDSRRISFETMDDETKARFSHLLDAYLAEKKSRAS